MGVVASWWLRAKQLERGDRSPGADTALRAIEARLARIEHAVEATAVEVERIAEGQRYATRLLADQRPAEALLPSAQQVSRDRG